MNAITPSLPVDCRRHSLPVLLAFIAVLSFSNTALRAAWTGAAGDGVYTNTANWAGGIIDGVFTGSLGAALPTSITLTENPYSFSGLTFSYTDIKNVSLIPPAGVTWNLGGNVSVDVSGSSSSIITLGAPSRLFTINLGGVQRTFSINESLATGAGGTDVVNLYGNLSGGSVRKTGGGTLNLLNTNSMAGDFTVEGGTVIAAGTSTLGAFSALNKVQVLSTNSNNFGRFVLNGTAANLMNDSAAIVLNGGLFGLQAPSGTALNETVGAVSINGSRSAIGVISATGATTLTLTSLFLDPYSTMAIASNTTGIGNANGFLKIATGNDANILAGLKGGGGSAGSTTTSILPWVSGSSPASGTIVGSPDSGYYTTGYGLVTYTSSGGFRTLTDAEYQTNLAAATANDNVKLTAPTTVLASKSINSLYITAAGDLNLGGNTLTLNSGAYASTAVAVNLTNGNLNFGAGVGYLLPGRATLTIQNSAALSAGAGFVFAGSANINVNGTVNAGTGPVVVNSGVVNLLGTDRLASGSALRVDRGALVSLMGGAYSQTLSSLSGLGTLDIGNAGAGFKIGTGQDAPIGRQVLVGNGGTISPGDTSGDFRAGMLTFGTGVTSLRFEAGSALTLDLSSASSFDSIALLGGATTINGGTLTVNLLDGFVPVVGQTFTSITGTSAAAGTGFTTIIDGSNSGYTYSLTALGNNWVLTVTGAAIPEPSSSAFLGGVIALIGAALVRRKRNVSTLITQIN